MGVDSERTQNHRDKIFNVHFVFGKVLNYLDTLEISPADRGYWEGLLREWTAMTPPKAEIPEELAIMLTKSLRIFFDEGPNQKSAEKMKALIQEILASIK